MVSNCAGRLGERSKESCHAARSAIPPHYFDIKVNPSAQSKSPAARRRRASESKRVRSAGSSSPRSENTCAFMAAVARPGHAPALGRDRRQRAAPVIGVGAASDQALSLEAVDSVGDAGCVDLQALPDLAQRQGARGREREEHHHFVAGEGQPERAQLRIGPGQEDLLQAHDGGDGGHGRCLRSPSVCGPLPVRLGDGVERQAASLGHGGTLPNLGREPTRGAAAPPAPGYGRQRATLFVWKS